MTSKRMPFVAIIGGFYHMEDQEKIAEAKLTARELGAALAKAGMGLVVYYSDPNSLEPHVVSGFVEATPVGTGIRSIRVRFAESQKHLVKFAEQATRSELFELLLFPGQDWEAPFFRSLVDAEGVDAVLLMAGKYSTKIAAQIAIARPLPTLAIDKFEGSARDIWEELARAIPGYPSTKTHTIPEMVEWLKGKCEGQVELPDHEEKKGVDIPSIVTPADYSPRVAGYISDIAGQELDDLLNIELEVANIANVLTYKDVQPPLALGLFGDWGSGKSFFMGKLRKYIGEIATHYQQEEQKNGRAARWCSRVAQIEFNAWHFSDSNLWASLVTRIYEGLDRELNGEKPTADSIKKKIIEAQIEEARGRFAEAETQLDMAKTQVNIAEQNLKEKRKEREEKENTLVNLISSIPILLKGSETKEKLQKAAKSLGIPEAAKTYEALEDLNGELKSVSGRLTVVTASILHSPWALLVMALLIVVLPITATQLIESFGTFLSDVGKRVAEISTFLLLILSWLQVQVRRGAKLVGVVESALEEARAVRKKRIEENPDVVRATNELTEAQAAEQAAHTNLELAQTDLQRLQLELQELRPERKLQRLIETRANTGAYTQHLGIISLIRADFENMSRILVEMGEQRQNFSDVPPIQRIILYIDDLDRCKPERVVEVLEAIHLLLYFKLFVVVVAVDPRWLRHSLSQHYPATLNEQGGMSVSDTIPGATLYSTPQDYLEKIFQIPFALRPIEKSGYRSLVSNLLKPLPSIEPARETAQQPPATDIPSGEKTQTNSDQPTQVGQEVGTDTERAQMRSSTEVTPPAESKRTTTEIFKPIPPRQLEFTEWEKEDIQQLWLMFRTPRTVKRFINIYRLLRAGLASDTEAKSFEGTPDHPGEYRVALLLLATITAFPNESNHFLYRLDAWLDTEERNKDRKSATWEEILMFLKSEKIGGLDVGAMEKNNQGNRAEEQMTNAGNIAPIITEEAQASETSWLLMLDCLDRVIQYKTWKDSFTPVTLRTWVVRVARFSFSVQLT